MARSEQKRKRKAAAAPAKQPKRAKEDDGEDAELQALGFEDALAAGLAFEQLGALEAAVEAFDVALRHQPSHCEALTRSADALSASGDKKKALERYKKASTTSAGREDASIWFRLGLAQSALDQDDEAAGSYEKARELGAQAIHAADEDEERRNAVKAYSVTLAALANCLGERGDLDGAVAVFEQATAAFPDVGNLHFNLATMRMARTAGSYDVQVVAALERAIECSPDTADFLVELAEYLEQHGKDTTRAKELRAKTQDLRDAAAPDKSKESSSSDENEEEEEDEEEEDDDEEEEESSDEE